MGIEQLNEWREFIGGVLALAGGLVAALWAYTKYVVERGVLAPAQFDIDCTRIDVHAGSAVLEILLRLSNVGSSTLVVKDVRVRLLYLTEDDEIALGARGNALQGRVTFPRSLEMETAASSDRDGENQRSGFLVVPYDTFVQPKVEQIYTFVTAVSHATRLVLIRASFIYAQSPNRFQRTAFRVSRRLGLIQYSLDHVSVPHTAERVFNITSRGDKEDGTRSG